MAPEIPGTRKKNKELFFLVSQRLKNLIHLSNTFYHLCYCNNKHPGETQSYSLAMWPFRESISTTAKKHAATKAHRASYKSGVNMHDNEGQKRSHRSTPRTRTPKETNITAFGQSLNPKPKPAQFTLLQTHFLYIQFLFSMNAKKNLDLPIQGRSHQGQNAKSSLRNQYN